MKRYLEIVTSFTVVLISLLGISVFVQPTTAHADVNNFTVNSMNADEKLTNTDKQGELIVTEKINVTFTDNNHGLLRALPEKYKGHSLKIHNVSVTSDTGAPSTFTTYGSNGNLVLKIGDPNQTVTGGQEYTIRYTVDNVVTFYKDHDELYWNINGTDWGQPFDYVGVTLTVPSGVRQSKDLCYTGNQGSTATDCVVTNADPSVVMASTTKPLTAHQALTIVTGFEKGYFQPKTWQESVAEVAPTVLKAVVLPIIVAILSFILWWKKGREPRGRGTIIPEYDAPDGLKPIEVGTIIDFKVDNRDLTATIIDLAIRKYITIIEKTVTHKLRKDSTSYTLRLEQADFSLLNSYEEALMIALFPDVSVGQIIDPADKNNELYSAADTIRTNVERDLTKAGYFRTNPTTSGSGLAVASFALFILLVIGGTVLGFAFAIGVAISAVTLFITSRHLASRTAKGVAANEDSLGLKLYLQTAEADRLKMLQGPNAAYAANVDAPVKTADLFEKLLPYAMVLGVEKEWAKQFDDIYKQAPSWYSGNFTTFNAFYLANSLSTGMQPVVNSAFTAPSSSGSSGFGGGGFSGGGGGGGGGGGW